MQAGRSLAQERFALPGRVLDTELHHGFIVAVTLLELLDAAVSAARRHTT